MTETQGPARLWERRAVGTCVMDEFATYTRLLGWRQSAEYHREASECKHTFSSTVYVLKFGPPLKPNTAVDETTEQRRRRGSHTAGHT